MVALVPGFTQSCEEPQKAVRAPPDLQGRPDRLLPANNSRRVVITYDYGAFVEIAQGVEGLIHVSENELESTFTLHKIS